MRRVLLAAGIAAALLGMGAFATASAASQGAVPVSPRSTVMHFDVVFSPFSAVAANNVRDPHSPFALGDELTFHDQLSVKGRHVGDEIGSCVLTEITPEVLANCSLVIRLPGGTIAGQFASAPGPAPKAIALTGGTGTYREVGGEGTLVEFGNGKGSLTLNVRNFVARGGAG